MRGMGRFLRNGASVAARPERRQGGPFAAHSTKNAGGGRNKYATNSIPGNGFVDGQIQKRTRFHPLLEEQPPPIFEIDQNDREQ